MKSSFKQTLIEVWRQALVENAAVVELGGNRYPVRHTPKRGLRPVDFIFEGNEIRGLEQNPDTTSRWAQMARSGNKVMQFLSEGRYVAVVVDGKVKVYGVSSLSRYSGTSYRCLKRFTISGTDSRANWDSCRHARKRHDFCYRQRALGLP